MEIYGYIPITNCPDGIDKDKALFEGKVLSNGKAVGILTVRFIEDANVPNGDPAVGGSVSAKYSKYATQSNFVNLSVNDNLDITSQFSIKYGSKTFNIPANTTTIINILQSDGDNRNIQETIDGIVEELKTLPLEDTNVPDDYADLWKDYTNFMITDGRVDIEEETSITGIKSKKHIWKGTLPLDKMIYVIQSNLDILMANNRMKGDSYASSYTNLFNAALGYAVDLEKTRIALWEDARKFYYRTKLEKYLGLLKLRLDGLKSLADYSNSSLDIVIKRIQSKLYNTQTQGFKANNNNKLLSAQLDSASTAFSAGMTETVPPTNNNAELMSLYTQVKTDMSII